MSERRKIRRRPRVRYRIVGALVLLGLAVAVGGSASSIA
jgi:hypothetical protein